MQVKTYNMLDIMMESREVEGNRSTGGVEGGVFTTSEVEPQ